MMNLPKKFTINTQEITVEMVDYIEDSKFGKFDPVLNLISVATKIKRDNEIFNLTTDQIWNTFFHELIHAWQFFVTGNTCEEDSCTYSGYIIEFLKTISFEN